MVLSVEASDIFNTADPVATLQTLYAKGVRTLQPLHQFNSKLGGVAWHDGHIKLTQTVKNLPNLHHLCKDNGGTGSYAKCDATLDQLNFKGLTYTGKQFVTRMLNLGMPVDIAHMSELGVKDLEPIVAGACSYPVYVSHAHVRSLLDEDSWKANKKHEKTVPDWELDLIRNTGGMVGLRTGSDYHNSDPYFSAIKAAGLSSALPVVGPVDMNGTGTLGGNEFHFAYALDYLFRVKGVNAALGSDFNGLIPQMVFSGESQDTKMAGLAHIGKLAVLFSKLAASGLDAGTFTQVKRNSAEAYVQMWERAEAFARGGSCCPTPSVISVIPAQAWYGSTQSRENPGAGFTPHAGMEVSVQTGPTSPPIACTDVDFFTSTDLCCTMPPLPQGTVYQVTVRNGGCGLESTLANAYYASPVNSGPVVGPSTRPSRRPTCERCWPTRSRRTDGSHPTLRRSPPSTGRIPRGTAPAPRPGTCPATAPSRTAARSATGMRSRPRPSRLPISPALEFLRAREDAALLTDPVTMIAACDTEQAEQAHLAATSSWPADWRAQLARCAAGRRPPLRTSSPT